MILAFAPTFLAAVVAETQPAGPVMSLLEIVLLSSASVAVGGAVILLGVALHRQLRSGAVQHQVTTSMRRAEMRERALKNSALFRMCLPWLRIIGNGTAQLDLEFLRRYIAGPYTQAGYPGGFSDDEMVSLGFLIGSVLGAFIGFSAVVLTQQPWPLVFGVFGIPVGFVLLVLNLKGRARDREVLILQALPYLLDLMVLMLRSGTSLRLALTRVVGDYEDHPIGVELGQVLAEIDAGAPRSLAFRKFADRLKIQDITSLADSIVQAEELGWPLAETLERFADRMSSERILRAQSKAGTAGVLVMIPSTLVLAAAILLLFGPVITRALRSGSFMQ